MKVILLDDVAAVGRRGEVRDVSDGYARNFLIPKQLALSASAGNLKNLDHIKKQQEAKADRVKEDAEALRRRIEAHQLRGAPAVLGRGQALRLGHLAAHRGISRAAGSQDRAAPDSSRRAAEDSGRDHSCRSDSTPTSPRSSRSRSSASSAAIPVVRRPRGSPSSGPTFIHRLSTVRGSLCTGLHRLSPALPTARPLATEMC